VTYFVSQGNTDSSSRYVGDVGEHGFNGNKALAVLRIIHVFKMLQVPVQQSTIRVGDTLCGKQSARIV
jgi:hypothetical protein